MDILYVKYDKFGSTAFTQYTGLDQSAVTALLADLNATNIEFITEADFLAVQPAPRH